MRVVFVDTSVFNIGVSILSSILKRAGHTVNLVHCPFPKDYRKNYFEHPDACFNYDAVCREIMKFSPDVVCFSLMSHNFVFYRQLSDVIKKTGSIPIIAGGVLPTIDADLVMTGSCDIAVIGEADNIICDVLANLNTPYLENIPNICYRTADGAVARTHRRYAPVDLDSLPHADFDLYPKTKILYISTSRGCVMSCSYCSSGRITQEVNGNAKKRVRKRTVEGVISEIEAALSTAEPNAYDQIFFFDDFFVTTNSWVKAFAAAYRERVAMPFYCMAFPATLTRENCRCLADAGCKAVYMGFQTANNDYKKNVLGRREAAKEVAKAIDNARAYGIDYRLDQIIGLPGHLDSHIGESLQFFVENRVRHVGVFFLSYFPNAPITDYAYSAGVLNRHCFEAIQQNALIGDWRFRGTVVDEDSADRDVRYAILFRLLGILPGRAVLWMHRRGFYRRFPVSWQFYSALVVIDILRYEGLTTAKLLISYVMDYARRIVRR